MCVEPDIRKEPRKDEEEKKEEELPHPDAEEDMEDIADFRLNRTRPITEPLLTYFLYRYKTLPNYHGITAKTAMK